MGVEAVMTCADYTTADDGDRTALAIEYGQVLSNECIAPNVYVMTLTAPRTARLCKPGQFVNVRLPKNGTELLRLPFSVYGVLQELGAIEIMYQVL
ncbi:MAG: hypothetical protein HGA54_09735, partial [Actinobacteria bacterium]|nr:hypothetical protein [Actinomycetota bacterium]